MYNYANCLTRGIGIESNKEEAYKYFKKASDYGHIQSYFVCGVLLLKGIGVSRNIRGSAKCFKIAADNGVSYGMCYYALILASLLKSKKKWHQIQNCYHKQFTNSFGI